MYICLASILPWVSIGLRILVTHSVPVLPYDAMRLVNVDSG